MRTSIVVALMITVSVAFSQQPPETNAVVQGIVSEVSESNLRNLIDKLVSFGTRHTLSDTTSASRGIGAARRWIKSEFEKYARVSGGRMTVAFHESIVPPSTRVPSPSKVVNVVATLRPRGVQPGFDTRLLVIGGHYDSRASDPMDAGSDAPGANDDGSGSALVLELARVLASRDVEATLVFIAFAGEEQGLLGAAQWSEMAKQNRWNVEAMFNNDIVGSSMGGDGVAEAGYVRLFSEAYSPVDTGTVFRMRNNLGLENDGPSRSLARSISETAAKYLPNFGVQMVYRRDRFLRGGDHSPFHERGFAAVRFTVARENYDWQHQNVRTENGKMYGDLPKFMDFPYLTNVARANAAAFASLAFAPQPPANVGILTRGLGYDTELKWDRNAEKDLAGYYVRYRQTTSPVWQHTVFTADTAITIKVLKDDYLFGVQAVDRDGNVSLVSIPRPVR
jgi:Zn-dependent M28 family amino/carboxypeptidase